jgi:hypothetical protein
MRGMEDHPGKFDFVEISCLKRFWHEKSAVHTLDAKAVAARPLAYN